MTSKWLKLYKNLCGMNQVQTRQFMAQFLRHQDYKNVTLTNNYVYAEGDIPIALVAHSDTVFKTLPREIFHDQEKNVIWSPEGMGADDKAGILMMIAIIKKYDLKPHIIVTANEEIGCLGASSLVKKVPNCPFAECKYLIQLDRRGADDCVFYDLDDIEFEKYIESFGFKTQWGSFSDISTIAPAWGIGAVNLSVGYEDEHSYQERLYVNWWQATLEKVVKMLNDAGNTCQWGYTERAYSYHYSGYPYGCNDWEDTCDCCHNPTPYADMLPVYTKDNPTYGMDICPDCFAKICLEMSWCSKCNKGWYGFGQQPKNWVCPTCAGKEVNTNAATKLNKRPSKDTYKF